MTNWTVDTSGSQPRLLRDSTLIATFCKLEEAEAITSILNGAEGFNKKFGTIYIRETRRKVPRYVNIDED